MKKIASFALLLLCLDFSSQAQTSTFYGMFSPVTSHLVPTVEPKNGNANEVIKPNFKGKEIMQETVNPAHSPDPVWQQHQNLEKASTATLNWNVQGLGTGISPPDPSGDADSLYYIQGTNAGGGGSYKIFNKTTGANVTGNLTMQSLGGPAGLGDPIILYHKAARRWFLTEFSSSGNKLLVHVSQTSNPQGAYHTYQFTCPSFPDYPKYGIWAEQDALVVSTNEGGPPTVYAMRLSNLLAGTASPFIGVDIGYSLNGFGFQSITPVDLEGDNPAPAGMKPTFMRHRDDESHSNGSPDSGTNDWIEIWEMTINWAGTSATVAKVQDVAIAEIDSDLCGLTSFSCIQQPTASPNQDLDPLRETVMYKIPMRVFSDHQSVVMALATDVTGTNRAGVRWIELRRPTNDLGAWTLYQEGTFSPGTTNRWMPSINMDKEGNILLAYSTSSGTAGDFPSLKYTGRRPCDPLGEMTIPEGTIIAGASSRTSNTRWGDYHHMSVDAFNELTFYFTGVYMAASNSIRTNVSSITINPSVIDAALTGSFQVNPGSICGSGATIGVIVTNKGTGNITSGTISWQVGAGPTTNQTYTSSQLNGMGTSDTIYINVTGLVAGSNTVNFESILVNGVNPDEADCNDVNSIVLVSAPGSLTVSANVTVIPSCIPGNDGQVQLSVSDGLAPYTYSFNGGAGQASSTFTGVGSGTFSYSITDNAGCVGSSSITVNNTTIINSTPSIATPIACFGELSGSISIAGTGGTPAYTYSIDGTTYGGSNTFNSLAAGTYTCYVKDMNGCIGTSSITLSQPTELNLNALPTAITCFGANDGSISATATNGTPTYSYSIDGVSYSPSSTFSGLSGGTYTVYAQDNNGCTTSFNTTVIEPTQVSLSGIATGATSNDGTITLTGANGTSPYTYSIDGTTYTSSSLFTGLSAGTYTCYVQDDNGCITSIQVIVNTLGIDEIAANGIQLVSLYPNPTTSTFTLEVNGAKTNQVQIKIFNMNGQLIAQTSLEVANGSATQTIELSKKIAAGQYYLGIYDGDATPIITKIVKQ